MLLTPLYLVVKGPYSEGADDADQGAAWSFGNDDYEKGKWLALPVACGVWNGDNRRALLPQRKRWLDVGKGGWKASGSSPPIALRYVLPDGGLKTGEAAPYPRQILGLLVVTQERKVIREVFLQR